MTLADLKTLLALNGNQRLPHLEVEIFADIILYTCYLESICSKYVWYKSYHKDRSGDLAWLVYVYTYNVIKDRWVEAEAVIAEDPNWMRRYRTFINPTT
jgi:hypothetical protein